LTSGYIFPQYHLVYDDDWFETVYAPAGEAPNKEWLDLCIYNRFQVIFDQDAIPAPLAPEWTQPSDQAQPSSGGRKVIQQIADRDTRDDRHFQQPSHP
jgi:hypothetical protein